MSDNSKCIILMPVSGSVEWATEMAVFELMKSGYAFNKMYGCANVDIARAVLASDALDRGFEELMWIDSDVSFDPRAVERLRSHDLPLVCGLYPKKQAEGGIAAILEEETEKIVFGEVGGLVPIRWAGTGFLYTKREVYEDIKRIENLPDCHSGLEQVITPYFMPFTIPNGDGKHHVYLGDDTSFCERARRCGYKIYADTTIRLDHVGKYRYSWEDISGTRDRFSSMVCTVRKVKTNAE